MESYSLPPESSDKGNYKFREFQVLLDQLVAMVTPDILGNQKQCFLMLHRLILKVTKFQFHNPKRFSTVLKNIFFGRGGPHVKYVKAVCLPKNYTVAENYLNTSGFCRAFLKQPSNFESDLFF